MEEFGKSDKWLVICHNFPTNLPLLMFLQWNPESVYQSFVYAPLIELFMLYSI